MALRRIQFSWPPVLCLLLGSVAAVCGAYVLALPGAYFEWSNANPAIMPSFTEGAVDGLVTLVFRLGLMTTAALVLTAYVCLFLKNRFTLRLYRLICLAAPVVGLVYAALIIRATDILFREEFKVNEQLADAYNTFIWRWQFLWPWLLGWLLLAYFYLLSWRRIVINQWTGRNDTEPAMGDRFFENLRTHGRDPVYRKSQWTSLSFYIFIIFLLPWLLTFFGCVTPYRVPKGTGNPEIQGKVVILKQVKKKKPKKRYIVNPKSTISFKIPDLDESKVAEQVEKETRLTYTADPMRVTGKGTWGRGTGRGNLGKGGGTEGGWPDGMENALVRFIRLKYDGSGWDDGMDSASRADLNFLDHFHRITKFKTASKPEAHGIALLAKYPKGYAPPFVYMTGDGGISVSEREVKILREYLMGGGMLFADCGSPAWNSSFRAFIARVMPGEPLRKIADDDVIFQLPYPFPEGAPPIWHHGGFDALGVKYKGRWAVFYHPGDINDAWKNNRGGLSPQKAEGAMEMGVNIIYYSFSNYLELTRKYRK